MAAPPTNATLLHLAAGSGDVDKVRQLLEHGSYHVNCTESLGQTPLHYACSEGRVSTVKLLVLDYNADKNIQDVDESTPLALLEKNVVVIFQQETTWDDHYYMLHAMEIIYN